MKDLIAYILQDWQINRETSLKSRLVLVLFRSAQQFGRWPFPFSLYRFLYQIIVEWILGIELPWDTQIGANLQLQHGIALVVNHETVIGENCILRHSTTIGNKKLADGSISASPKIGNNVDIGAHVVVIGPVSIGDNAVIGAGSVIIKDVPEGAVAVGNPARIVRMRNATLLPNLEKDSTLEITSSSSLETSRSQS